MKKIPTLFERVFENHKIIEVLPNITPGCEEAFLHGDATLKVDGTAVAIIDGEYYKRYDAKAGKPIPEGAIPCQEDPDPITGHFPCWVKCDRESKGDRWLWEAYDDYISMSGSAPSDGTYEAFGPKINGNPYHLMARHVLYRHGSGIIFDVTRTFEGVKEWLETNEEEGIVFWLNGEPVCKIKRSDFGLPWNKKH